MNDLFRRFTVNMRRNLAQPLPGPMAQFGMAPVPRPDDETDSPPRPDARQSSVLVLFYPYAGTVYFPLILRPTYPGVHSGQVGLPGGGREPQDGDLVATALREAREEIGVSPGAVEILGKLSPLYVRPSNNMVLPVVGCCERRPDFEIDPREVALLIEAPLVEFLEPGNKHVEVWQLRDRVADVPYFRVQQQIIWGATAMILGELFALPAIRRLEFTPEPPYDTDTWRQGSSIKEDS
ncbi:MAG: CoA pyrophosphatase [Caldilineaceae bacterium]|nr:CoA pyrophosphatase [Caldilineaceae bacterium]